MNEKIKSDSLLESEDASREGYMPRIAAIGGGTGMSTLLNGLKLYTSSLSAIVTVTDDGGSSGRLRSQLDMIPPGDIRNCLTALAPADSLMQNLFEYRFAESDMEGHSFGNLLLTALTKITGDFATAVEEANKILNVQGKVIPATLDKVTLVAHHIDGSKSTGETVIGSSSKRIKELTTKPIRGRATEDAVRAAIEADMIVIGPGSLYTSLVPNLLVKGIPEAIARSNATKVCICNIMTQPETSGFTASDHISVIMEYMHNSDLDYVVLNTAVLPQELRARYMSAGSYPVAIDRDVLQLKNYRIVEEEMMDLVPSPAHKNDEDAEIHIRHNPVKLASLLMEIVMETLNPQMEETSE